MCTSIPPGRYSRPRCLSVTRFARSSLTSYAPSAGLLPAVLRAHLSRQVIAFHVYRLDYIRRLAKPRRRPAPFVVARAYGLAIRPAGPARFGSLCRQCICWLTKTITGRNSR